MSIQSMTAYGFGEHKDADTTYRCEIRTLNSRFLEASIKMPRTLIAIEPDCLNIIKSKLHRGKIDVFISISSFSTLENLPSLNQKALEHYLSLVKNARSVLKKAAPDDAFSLNQSLTSSIADFLKFEGVLEQKETVSAGSCDEKVERGKKNVFDCIEKAIEQVIKARKTEGLALEQALSSLVTEIEQEHIQIIKKAPIVREQLYASYVKRLETLMKLINEKGLKGAQDLPQDRLLLEIGILAEKSDIEEELARLSSHIKEFRSLLGHGDAVGRKLDFFCQEMHREINTISNKLVQIEISQHTLNLKQAVERLKQQVQNIE